MNVRLFARIKWFPDATFRMDVEMPSIPPLGLTIHAGSDVELTVEQVCYNTRTGAVEAFVQEDVTFRLENSRVPAEKWCAEHQEEFDQLVQDYLDAGWIRE